MTPCFFASARNFFKWSSDNDPCASDFALDDTITKFLEPENLTQNDISLFLESADKLEITNQHKIKGNDNIRITNVDWLKNNIFETDDISTLVKVRILNELWKAQFDNQLWYIEKEYINEYVLRLYDTYLIEKKDLWPVSDYSFYGVFHDLKIISDIKDDLKKKLIDFWKDKKIELLCAQTLDIESFSISAFNVSDFENELFGSKYKFTEFIESHKDNEKPEILEYLEFLHLQKVTNFEKYLKFNFRQSDLIKEKINIYSERDLAKTERDEYDSIKQVIIEVNNGIAFQRIVGDEELRKIHRYSKYYGKENNHLYLYLDSATFQIVLTKFCQRIVEIIKKEPKWSEAKFIEQNIIEKVNFIAVPNEEFYIKIISVY